MSETTRTRIKAATVMLVCLGALVWAVALFLTGQLTMEAFMVANFVSIVAGTVALGVLIEG